MDGFGMAVLHSFPFNSHKGTKKKRKAESTSPSLPSSQACPFVGSMRDKQQQTSKEQHIQKLDPQKSEALPYSTSLELHYPENAYFAQS